MFGSVGGPEIFLILVLALLLFGPRQLPKIGRTVGSALAEFRRATQDFKVNLEREVDLDGVRDVRRDMKDLTEEVKGLRVARDVPRPAPSPPSPPPSPPPSSPPTAPDGQQPDADSDETREDGRS